MASATNGSITTQQHPPQETLESQVAPEVRPTINWRDRLRRAFTFSLHEPEPDVLEQWLLDQLLRGEVDPDQRGFRGLLDQLLHGQVDHDQREFLRIYRRLKQSPGADIVESLTHYHVFCTHALPGVSQDSYDSTATHSIENSTITVSHAFDEFCSKIRLYSDASLRICVLSMKLPSSLHSVLFSFGDKMIPNTENLNALYDIPSRSILSLIQKEWDPEKTWIKHSFARKISPSPQPRVLLSKVKPSCRFSLFNENRESSTVEFNLVSNAPSYHSDLYEYIWQRQTQRPPIERVVFSTSPFDSVGSRSVFISIDSDKEALHGERCAEILRAFSEHFAAVLPVPAGDQAPCSIESAYLGALFAVLLILAETTNDFINCVDQNISTLCYRGRSHPSGSKLHYISHLQDNHKVAVCSIHDALDLLAEIQGPVERCDEMNELRIGLPQIKRDLEYLRDNLVIVEAQIIALQTMMREKIELRQIRRTYILTVLAAVYLPFAFMTVSCFSTTQIMGMTNRNSCPSMA
ncbi:hypothetical protein ONS95_002040 [Cadophora gregata]|uniref:uncharacterized protein n=1 Tax=Cadophora gregata TaxID=51156 RepID=UPI0026DC9DCE|nr:uncharacterized protein ONS95_002040 [Cadophora gregata]KAK0111696.1 hypothetical protein ONS95_002040 [Cadophora gregata]